MPFPTDDPLLDFYAEQYAARTGDNLTTAKRIVDGKPNMQALLGRVDGDMTYAEACETAGIPVPAAVPAARVIVEPEPAKLPATEVDLATADAVGPGDPLFDAGVDAAAEFAANGIQRDDVYHDIIIEAGLERGHELLGDPTATYQFKLGITAGYDNLAGSDVPPISEEETDPGPHPVRHTGDDELPDDSEELTEADLSTVKPEPVANVVDLHPNTLVTLTYAARTQHSAVVSVSGVCDPALVERINAKLVQGLWLIPEQIGLPNPRPVDKAIDHHDHPYCGITFRPTATAATQARSLAELADDIDAVPFWDSVTFNPTQEVAA